MKSKKKNRLFRRLAALGLAFFMIITAGTDVSAKDGELTGDTTAEITVEGTEGTGTVTAYKIIDVKIVNGQPAQPVYTWSQAVAGWIQEQEEFAGYTEDGTVTEQFLNLENGSREIKTFVDSLAAAVSAGQVSLDPAGSAAAATGGVKFSLPFGSYLFLVTGGVRIYSPGFASVFPEYTEGEGWQAKADTIQVTEKSMEPAIEKTAEDTASQIGGTVSYTLKVTVPQYPEDARDKKMILADYMCDGLTFQEGSLKLYRAGSSGEIDLDNPVPEEWYSSYEFPEDGRPDPGSGKTQAFAIRIAEDRIASLGTVIYAKYEAEVNENALVLENGEKDNRLLNKAYLVYSNAPYTEDGYYEIPDEEQVYTYGLRITKTDAQNQEELLPGAEFTLTGKDGLILFSGENGIYKADPRGTEDTLVTNSEGKIQISGLDTGTYTLTETKAPAGYPLPGEPRTTIQIQDTDHDGLLDHGATGFYEATITNRKASFILPKTGGIGTAVFTAAGVLLMGGAVALLAFFSRKKK